MKYLIFIIFCSFVATLQADEGELLNTDLQLNSSGIYKNIRESKSRYINKHNRDEVLDAFNDSAQISIVNKIINNPRVNFCASKIITEMKSAINFKSKKDLELAILSARFGDNIDDVVVSLLLRAISPNNKFKLKINPPKQAEEISEEDEKIALKLYESKMKELRNEKACPEDTYRALYVSVASHSNLFNRQFKKINRIALSKQVITEEEFNQIETFRSDNVHQWQTTLAEYRSNLISLREAYPNRVKEEAVLVTDVKFRQENSIRQSLHARFNSTQIILISEVMTNLRKRLDSESVTISFNYADKDSEIMTLTPMEKFRLIIKILRKEMSVLNNSRLLSGQRVSYSDVIAASYEVGFIGSLEIEQLASLEEIWNPKKTKKEKVMFWVKTFGQASAVLLPPPYGFLSVLAIMIIDQQLADPKADPNADYNLL
jgi:hypothetical protein